MLIRHVSTADIAIIAIQHRRHLAPQSLDGGRSETKSVVEPEAQIGESLHQKRCVSPASPAEYACTKQDLHRRR